MLSLQSCLKTVVHTYVSNKAEWFSYKSRCGIHTCNKALERRDDLEYGQFISNLNTVKS